jgi:hypothetical protein
MRSNMQGRHGFGSPYGSANSANMNAAAAGNSGGNMNGFDASGIIGAVSGLATGIIGATSANVQAKYGSQTAGYMSAAQIAKANSDAKIAGYNSVAAKYQAAYMAPGQGQAPNYTPYLIGLGVLAIGAVVFLAMQKKPAESHATIGG